MFGKLIALPFRIINAPIRAAENLISGENDMPEDERLFSKPLDLLAKEIEKTTEKDDEKS